MGRYSILPALLAIMLSLFSHLLKADSAEIYHQYCSVCHGDKGDGKSRATRGLVPPPKDFTEKGLGETLGRAAMIAIVRGGKPGTAMTGWKSRLSDSEISGVVDFIRNSFMKLPPTVTVGDVSHPGAELYAENCSVCHGDQGKGAIWGGQTLQTVPRDFSSEWLPAERMIKSVMYGVAGSPMPGFDKQLSRPQIDQIVGYIQTYLMPEQTGSAALEEEVSWAAGKEADITNGKAFYFANCVTCHGEKGDGKGPRAYFIYPKPRSFIDSGAKRFTRKSLFIAIRDGVKGREMPAWGKVLSEQKLLDISEYVYQEFIYAEED